MKKIRVLHVASSHMMGLTNQETQLALAYKSLADVDITVVSGENEQVNGSFNALNFAGIPFEIINGFDSHRNIFRLIKRFKNITKRIKPDIVSVNTNWQLVIVSLARFLSRQNHKIIYTIHGFRHNHPIKSIIARSLIGSLLFLFADVINAPTSYVCKNFAWLKYKIKTIPLGEDDLFFINSKLPDFSKPLSFCFAGQFREGKNQSMLIAAFSDYLEKTHDLKARLILPGEGELLESCKILAIRLGVSDQVIFPGQLNRIEMIEVYKNCQIALVPTNSETFGHCIAEPLVMKRIVLSRPVGIASDVIINGVNGYFFDTKSQLVDTMLAMRELPEVDLIRISECAGKIGQIFNWIVVAKMNVKELMKPIINL